MAWTDYILTPDQIYPNLPVFSANYTLNQTDYIASIHYDPTPAFTFNQFSSNLPFTNQFLTVNRLNTSPIFESGLFGYTFIESTHSYKNGAGSVSSNDIAWNSSFELIITRRYLVGSGFQSEYKTFYNQNGTGGSLNFAYSNSVYSNFLNNSFSPDFDHWRWQSNQTGSLNITISASKPSWLDPETPPPPPPPPPGETVYQLYFHETSDHGFEMDEQNVTANVVSQNGWAINNGKAYLFG